MNLHVGSTRIPANEAFRQTAPIQISQEYKKTVVITAYRDSWRETWIGITCLRPSFAGMRKRSLHGGIHGVSQTGDPGTCRLVKHRCYKNSINEMLLYFKSQFEFVFINVWMKGCFSSYRSFIPDSSAWMRGWYLIVTPNPYLQIIMRQQWTIVDLKASIIMSSALSMW